MKRTLVLLLLLVGCGETETAGEAIRFPLQIVTRPVEGEVAGVFTTRTGFRVELDEAVIALGPIRVHERAPATAHRFRLSELFIRTAHAHGGFDDHDFGALRGEYAGTLLFDALGAGRSIELAGTSGAAREATVELAAPAASMRAARGHTAYVRGTARRGDEAIAFEGGLTLPGDDKSRTVSGIPASLELAQGSAVRLALHLERWFDEADFGALAPALSGDVRTITPGGQVHAAWFLGARSAGAFTIEGDK